MRVIESFSCLLGLATLGTSLAYPGLANLKNRQAGVEMVEHPAPPGFQYLYTGFAHCLNAIYTDHGPNGIRIVYPTVGGNFSGPYFSGMLQLLVAPS
jgi:hypothetical protein